MGYQQEEPLRRHNVLHEVAEVVRSRAPVKKTLNIILTRIRKLCESVEFGLAELERCEDRPQKVRALPSSSCTCSTEADR